MSEVRLEKKGRRIEVRCADPLPGFRTAIPGAYETASGYWTVPANFETCVLLRQKYGRRLVIGPRLSRWAKGVRQSRDQMSTLARADDAVLDVLPKVAPKLSRAMGARKYQRVGVKFIADNHATLVADEPGLGKTLIAMGGIIESQVSGPYLVIAPKTASRAVWEREIKRWLPHPHTPVVMPEMRWHRERKLNRTYFDEHRWLIVHPEMVMVQTWLVCQTLVKKRSRKTGEVKLKKCGKRTPQRSRQKRELDCGHIKTPKTLKVDEARYPHLFKVKWGAIIIDESHESLIRRSGVPTQRRNGMDKVLLRPDGLRIAMSGTPMNNHPHQLWGTLNWLDPIQYSAFHRWAELYWQKGGFTGFAIGEFRQDREPLLWDSLSSIALRRTKLEVAKDLPPKTYVGTPYDPDDEDSPVGIWLEMEGKQAKAYRQMHEQSAAQLDSGRLEAITPLAELTRLKQLACSYGDIESRKIKVRCQDRPCPSCLERGYHREYRYKYAPSLPSNKFDWLVNSLEEWGFPDKPVSKVIVASFYTGLLDEFSRRLESHFKTKPKHPLTATISGKVKNRERNAVIDRFNTADHEHVLMLNVKAGGTAITIDTADRTVFLSETRIPDQQLQVEDRTHRVSKPRKCWYYYLRSLGTVDVGTAFVNKELASQSTRLLDERRGADYLRYVMELST